MKIGLVGAGNIARALATGWGEPILCSDTGSGRAEKLVREFGGEVVSNAELAHQADLVVLCHKPDQLEAVAPSLQTVRAVASVLGKRTVAELSAAYPEKPVFRFMPNTAVAVRHGVICYSPAIGIDPELEQRVLQVFGKLGKVVTMSEPHLEIGVGIAGVGPAYLALIAEAQIDSAVKAGMPASLAAELTVETLAGCTELLKSRDVDTLGVRREVTSPGGVTAKGLAQLERAGLRTAFDRALDKVIKG